MIKGVLFDKDGTLLRFEDLWLPAARSVIRNFCFINHIPFSQGTEERILRIMGVERGCIRQDAPFAYMTYGQIGAAVAEKMELSAALTGRQMGVLFETVLECEDLPCTPTCDLGQLFGELEKRNIRTGLATADNRPVTERCLSQLGIREKIDFIGCDDGVLRPKPQKDMFLAFCQRYQLRAEEVAVVGDTVNDMKFAKRCGGMAVGVLCGLSGRGELAEMADIVIETPLGILDKE